MKMPLKPLAILISVSALYGCASGNATKMNVPDVHEVRAAKQHWSGNISLTEIQSLKGMAAQEAIQQRVETEDGSRYQALRDSAYSLGVQAGLYQRRLELNEMLKKARPQLARIFDFAPYMLPGNVFPPVITETDGMLSKQGTKQLRKVRHSYHILTMPQLLIEPPTYLNYLVRHYPAPSRPDSIRLPVGEIEEKNWKIWIEEAWAIGRKQADMQYESDKNRLQRDLMGIRLFHDLVAKNVISMPRLSKQDFGVVKSKDGRTLSIGDEVLTIVGDSIFESSDKWRPITGD